MKEVNSTRFQKKQPEDISFRGDAIPGDAPNIAKRAEGPAKAVEMIKEMLGIEGSITKATKSDDGWEVEIEVVERSEYMKRIGIPKPVYDKNIYRVILDRNFGLVSYERRSQKPFGGSAE